MSRGLLPGRTGNGVFEAKTSFHVREGGTAGGVQFQFFTGFLVVLVKVSIFFSFFFFWGGGRGGWGVGG